MRMKLSTWLLITVVISIWISTGCQSGNRGTPTLIDQVGADQATDGIESFSQIYHLYPSPGEMLSIIDMSEMTFDATLLIPVGNIDKYLDTRSKTYMLGVYMTDLAYSALFGRHEATLDYLEAVRELSEDIRIDKAVDDQMIQKAKDNIEYLDSLYNISNEAFMNIISYCDRNERSNTVVMLSASAFTESLFLAVNMIDDYEEADDMLQHLADQKYTIDNFMTFAASVRTDDANVAATIENLQKIYGIYKGIDPGTGSVTVSNEKSPDAKQPKKLVIGGSGSKSQPTLSHEDFDKLKSAVVELRTKITEG